MPVGFLASSLVDAFEQVDDVAGALADDRGGGVVVVEAVAEPLVRAGGDGERVGGCEMVVEGGDSLGGGIVHTDASGGIPKTPGLDAAYSGGTYLFPADMSGDMSILSRVGVGSATVDTKVPERVTAGETISGTVEIEGGSSDQQIDAIYFALETRYRRDEGSSTAVIDKFQLTDSFTIEAGAERVIDIDIDIPLWTPLTRGRTEVWIETGLDIDWALDPDDTDHIEVEPTDRMARVFDAVADLGFELKTAEPEAAPAAFPTDDRPFVQEFDFVPQGGPFRGDLDEIDVVFEPTPDELAVYLEIDPRESITSALTDSAFTERVEEAVIDDQPTAEVATELERLLDRSL